jgi:hypothetical protein
MQSRFVMRADLCDTHIIIMFQRSFGTMQGNVTRLIAAWELCGRARSKVGTSFGHPDADVKHSWCHHTFERLVVTPTSLSDLQDNKSKCHQE